MTDNERLFRIIWPERCWHNGWKGKYSRKTCPKCGKTVHKIPSNPRFAHSDEIATAMMEAGLWEEFKLWTWGYFDTGQDPDWDSKILDTFAYAEKLKRAIIAWREGK